MTLHRGEAELQELLLHVSLRLSWCSLESKVDKSDMQIGTFAITSIFHDPLTRECCQLQAIFANGTNQSDLIESESEEVLKMLHSFNDPSSLTKLSITVCVNYLIVIGKLHLLTFYFSYFTFLTENKCTSLMSASIKHSSRLCLALALSSCHTCSYNKIKAQVQTVV